MQLHELIAFAGRTFEKLSIPYFVTGSCASISYGEPRLTNDIDVVAMLGNKDIKSLLQAFPPSEFYLSEEAMREAILRKQQFNILHPSSGLKVDVMIAEDNAFNRSRFSRAKVLPLEEGSRVMFASPEDVIIKKMEYYQMGSSEKHLRDITGMLAVSDQDIDQSYISSWARQLNLTDVWEAVLQRLKQQQP